MVHWRAYSSYGDSGESWIGQIPTHWAVERLKYNVTEPGAKLAEKPAGAMYLGLENIASGTGRLLLESTAEEVSSAVVAFRKGDVLFGKLRPYLAKVVHAGFDGVCTTELLDLRPASTVYGRYLFYLLLSQGFVSTVDGLTYGSKMPRASSEQVLGLAAALPPLPEQRAIAAFLDRQTARIDALIALKERQIALLQEKRAALINHAVTKGLDPKVPMKDSGIEWLGTVPAHWAVVALRWLAELQRGHDLPSSEREPGNVPVVSSGGISDYHSVAQVPGPGVVTGRYGTIGHAVYVDEDYWPLNTTLYVKDFHGNHPRYVFYLLPILPFDAFSGKSAVPGVDRNDLHPLRVVCPPLSEQRAIAAFLDRETARIDTVVAKVRASIETLYEYRIGLISAAVTGKIDVRQEVSDGV